MAGNSKELTNRLEKFEGCEEFCSNITKEEMEDSFCSNVRKILRDMKTIENLFNEIEEKRKQNEEIKSEIKRWLSEDQTEFASDVGNAGITSNATKTKFGEYTKTGQENNKIGENEDSFCCSVRQILKDKKTIDNLFVEIEEKMKKNSEIKSEIKRLINDGSTGDVSNIVDISATLNSTDATTTYIKRNPTEAHTTTNKIFSSTNKTITSANLRRKIILANINNARSKNTINETTKLASTNIKNTSSTNKTTTTSASSKGAAFRNSHETSFNVKCLSEPRKRRIRRRLTFETMVPSPGLTPAKEFLVKEETEINLDSTPIRENTRSAQTAKISFSSIYRNRTNQLQRMHRTTNHTNTSTTLTNAISGATKPTNSKQTKSSTKTNRPTTKSTKINHTTSTINHTNTSTTLTKAISGATKPTNSRQTKTSTNTNKPITKSTNINHTTSTNTNQVTSSKLFKTTATQLKENTGKAQEPIRKSFSFMHRNRTNELKKTLSTTNHTNAPTTSTEAIGGAAKPTNTTKTLKTHANEPASSKSSNISHKTSQVTEKSEKPTRMFRHGTIKVPTISTNTIIGATKPTNTEQTKISTNTYNSTSTNTNRPKTKSTNISHKSSINTNNTISSNIYRAPGENSKWTKVEVKDSCELEEIEKEKRRLTLKRKNTRPVANIHTSPTEKATNATAQNLNDGLPNSINTEDKIPSMTSKRRLTFELKNTRPVASLHTSHKKDII
ncbi:hypothetical protein HELRODRAFT_171166 [Helobdella robusta]|uniref:Uncharacterized protein n=1 Tax=Helobdella robusta TaxID=6412 RepID=T1F3W2_HELRO|nr:hypothetical protein HELRODRAFT_171166 [Helobdella robusta]ESO05528.1 hypothetical protein HELRODRAFT_171166 [Helobdella robusta]